jgi:hypothetical protein
MISQELLPASNLSSASTESPIGENPVQEKHDHGETQHTTEGSEGEETDITESTQEDPDKDISAKGMVSTGINNNTPKGQVP